MKVPFVTVKTFTFPHEAAVIRGRLESEGIECHLKDELTTQVHPFYSNAIGGVKLQVREYDEAAALEIIEENETHLDEEKQIVAEQTLPRFSNKQHVICPNCHTSDEVSKPQLSGKAFAISYLLLGFPIPFISKTYHCFNCGVDFKKR